MCSVSLCLCVVVGAYATTDLGCGLAGGALMEQGREVRFGVGERKAGAGVPW